MSSIVTIGGGDIARKSTLKIDKEIIRLSGKKNPKFLFVPTASSDSESYCKNVKKYFGDYLGCKIQFLLLIKSQPNIIEIRKKILSADIIYVGGGNTLKMMRIWRRLSVDKILKIAHKKGVVLCGVSAGSICWYEYGHSDSLAYSNKSNWKYIKVKGIGLIKGTHCPHYNSATRKIPRRKYFQNMIKKSGDIGIAIEDNCAIEYIDDSYRVISSKPNMKSYKIYKKFKKIILKSIPEKKSFSLIKELFNKNDNL